MGPIALFDKSFLQALTLNEACLFDQFFSSNLCPIFMVEVLADLTKPSKNGPPVQRVVEALAEKTPCLHSYPNIFHQGLIRDELSGNRIDMSGRPHVGGGYYAKSPKGVHIGHDEPPEMIAFSRWQRGQFQEIERDFAAGWRAAIESLDLKAVSASLRDRRKQFGPIRNLADARAAAAGLVNDPARQWAVLKSICTIAGMGEVSIDKTRRRWVEAKRPLVRHFLPYGTFVLEVDLFFEICLMQSMIGDNRPSNKVDISYLYYLPFCQIFISRDRLHQRTASLFLRPQQQFVWGDDIKSDLAVSNDLLVQLPQEVRNEGLLKFAKSPPKEINGKVAELWDNFIPNWRNSEPAPKLSAEKEAELLAELKRGTNAPRISPKFLTKMMQRAEPESMHFTRSIPIKRGDWYVLPKDFKG